MHKEIIISIVIILTILVTNYITQNYTSYSIEAVSEKLNSVREEVIKENVDNNKIVEYAKQVQNKWYDVRAKLACYLEHDELEKIETELTAVSSYVEKEEYSEALASVDRGTYILQHLKEKDEFTLINIF